jgi:CBS domain-containing protein
MKDKVEDVMTTRVVWVKKDATFKEMAAALRQNRVSAFPVVDDDGKVIGVVSEADMLTKEALQGGYDGMPGMITGILRHKEQEKARGVTAADLMTSPAATVAPGDSITRAARLMYTRRFKRLPVVDATGRLVGIVSRADLLATFERSDDDIRGDIRDVMLNEFLTDPADFTVTVKDGVVTLEGRPETIDVGRELVRQIRHLSGVVAIRDRLSYPPREHTESWTQGEDR